MCTTAPVFKSAWRQSIQNYKTFFQFIWHWQTLKVQVDNSHVRTFPWADLFFFFFFFFLFFFLSTKNIFSPLSQKRGHSKTLQPWSILCLTSQLFGRKAFTLQYRYLYYSRGLLVVLCHHVKDAYKLGKTVGLRSFQFIDGFCKLTLRRKRLSMTFAHHNIRALVKI